MQRTPDDEWRFSFDAECLIRGNFNVERGRISSDYQFLRTGAGRFVPSQMAKDRQWPSSTNLHRRRVKYSQPAEDYRLLRGRPAQGSERGREAVPRILRPSPKWRPLDLPRLHSRDNYNLGKLQSLKAPVCNANRLTSRIIIICRLLSSDQSTNFPQPATDFSRNTAAPTGSGRRSPLSGHAFAPLPASNATIPYSRYNPFFLPDRQFLHDWYPRLGR